MEVQAGPDSWGKYLPTFESFPAFVKKKTQSNLSKYVLLLISECSEKVLISLELFHVLSCYNHKCYFNFPITSLNIPSGKIIFSITAYIK